MLLGHVARIGVPLGLDSEHVGLDLLAELRHVIDVVEGAPISPLDVSINLILAPLLVHL